MDTLADSGFFCPSSKQVNLSAKQFFQITLKSDKLQQARHAVGMKIYHHIDVAGGRHLAARCRAKDADCRHAKFPFKLGSILTQCLKD